RAAPGPAVSLVPHGLPRAAGGPRDEGPDRRRGIREHSQHAFDLGLLCSNDPVCATHSPENDTPSASLKGRVPWLPLRCERFNRYLDRALVVPSLGHWTDRAFFTKLPLTWPVPVSLSRVPIP